MKLTKEELLQIKGGELTSQLINSISRGITTFLDLGRALGSAIRRAVTGKSCSL